MCSPIMEISTWEPHCEHLIVGRKADSLAMVMVIEDGKTVSFSRPLR